MEPSNYDLTAIRVIASHLEAEVPYDTVSKVLTHEGWVDLVTVFFHQYPQAYLEMCLKHAREIELELDPEGRGVTH